MADPFPGGAVGAKQDLAISAGFGGLALRGVVTEEVNGARQCTRNLLAIANGEQTCQFLSIL